MREDVIIIDSDLFTSCKEEKVDKLIEALKQQARKRIEIISYPTTCMKYPVIGKKLEDLLLKENVKLEVSPTAKNVYKNCNDIDILLKILYFDKI
jgi:hypothetical protein